MKLLVTGGAGVIEFPLSNLLLNRGYEVREIDNLNDYYDISLKEGRLEILSGGENYCFYKMDFKDKADIDNLLNNTGQITW